MRPSDAWLDMLCLRAYDVMGEISGQEAAAVVGSLAALRFRCERWGRVELMGHQCRALTLKSS